MINFEKNIYELFILKINLSNNKPSHKLTSQDTRVTIFKFAPFVNGQKKKYKRKFTAANKRVNGLNNTSHLFVFAHPTPEELNECKLSGALSFGHPCKRWHPKPVILIKAFILTTLQFLSVRIKSKPKYFTHFRP